MPRLSKRDGVNMEDMETLMMKNATREERMQAFDTAAMLVDVPAAEQHSRQPRGEPNVRALTLAVPCGACRGQGQAHTHGCASCLNTVYSETAHGAASS